MKHELTRRDLLGRAGFAIGGALALGTLQSCSDAKASDSPAASAGPQVSDFPYEKHLPAGFQLDVATLKQAAYAAYFNGGCCHGAFSALLGDLQRAGAPFTSLPLGFGKFGGGGVDGYGSICGAALGSVLVLNMVIEDAANRKKLVTELLRWYERFAFASYVPKTNLDPAGKTLTFDGATADAQHPAAVAVVPHSHLCHVSVTTWCDQNRNVDANGPDKKSRCARLTADVAGKVAQLINVYLASGAYGARTAAAPAVIAGNCMSGTGAAVGCHNNSQTPAKMDPVVAAGMECKSCHTQHLVVEPATASCTPCHTDPSYFTRFPGGLGH